MISWFSTWAFLFFIPLIVLFLFFLFKNKKIRPTFKFSNTQVFSEINLGVKTKFIYTPIFFIFLGLILSILALARPQLPNNNLKRNVEGIDIIVALDISDSMLIEDMKPKNRLESSKKIIDSFIDKRVSDRIGLIVFSGESYTRVPLTLDYAILKRSLESVKTTRNIKMGTAIGVALANAVARLKDSTAKSRVIVFLTDGESNSGTISPETALEIAKGFGIKIYSIGMGQDGMARLPVYLRGRGGKIVKTYRSMHSKVNVELLKKMASETNGKFFRATTTRALQGVFDEINQLEKSKIEATSFVRYEEVFKDFLIWGLAFYLLAILLEIKIFRRFP